MDDQQIFYQRADASMQMMAEIQGEDTESRAVFSQAQNRLLTNKLLTVISELVETMADALSKDRETARECVRRASAVLLSCARDGDESVDLTEPNETRVYRGGLAPWQVRGVTAYIDANLNASLSCEVLARLTKLSVSYFARAFKSTFGCSPHVFLKIGRAHV